MSLIFFTVFGTVLVAELVGDKLLITTSILATRFATLSLILGMSLAFMAKVGVAVVIGQAVSNLPPLLMVSITAITFVLLAITLLRKANSNRPGTTDLSVKRATAISFAAIFFSEWGDVGQITVATLAARYRLPLLVWSGAVAALLTKGLVAAFVGVRIRAAIETRISPRVLNYIAVGLLLILGVLTLVETWLRMPGSVVTPG